ncbi:glycosyltransferase family 2 protein [Bradyrhizobium valentinum]|uniref:glycosyltransferase family 2 protein n=1 Tax=Bradyrhizobium valentinum TaxID=1518501 RepID=UPI00070C0F79|nr:glycosyltransferase [Bradyrhizobium valentinum]KRQ97104.1 glycosyl transferase [Bradyrhizobium valentinum]
MSANEIGIVAIGRNEGQRLIECLASVKSATNNIVYVDSGSTDGSIAAAEEIGALVVKLDLTQPFTAARARNEGFAALKADRPNVSFVQFIDGDCIMAHDWLNKALTFVEQRKDVAVVCGRLRERYPTASVYNQFLDLEWSAPIGEAISCGGIALMRVQAFEAVRGFHSRLIAGEEPELCVRLRKIGWKIWRLDEEMAQHDAAMSRFDQWWVRCVRGGHAHAEVSRIHKGSQFQISAREIASTAFWGGLAPVLIGFGTLVHPLALCGAIIYPIQVCRIAIRRGVNSSNSWLYAVFLTVAKFAQMQGLLQFYWRRWRGNTSQLIEYK